MSNKTGALIKKLRTKYKFSQFNLEVGIGAASGSVSRFESGRVNPSRETLDKIAKVMKINPLETAQLLGVEFDYFAELIKLSQKIANSDNLDDIIRLSLNDVNDALGFVGCAIYLVEGNKICIHSLTSNEIVRITLKALPFSIMKIKIPLDPKSKNPIVMSYFDKKPYVTFHVSDMMSPPFPKFFADKSQQINKVRSLIAMPHIYEGKCYGVSVFSKKYEDNFEAELEILKTFCDIVAVGLAKLADSKTTKK